MYFPLSCRSKCETPSLVIGEIKFAGKTFSFVAAGHPDYEHDGVNGIVSRTLLSLCR